MKKPLLRMQAGQLARTALAGLAGLVMVSVLPTVALAQAWPVKQPIKVVVPFPPGGSVDQLGRILMPALSQALGQTIVIDYKAGASGAIGTAAVAASPPDGYNFVLVFDTHGVNPSLIPNMAFDTKKDLAPVIVFGTAPMVIATPVGSPYKTFSDVVAAAKNKPGVSYGTIGSGSLGHLAMTLLAKNGNLDLVHIPYKGGGPLMNDAVAGHVPLSIGSVFVTKPHLDSKRLRPLVVTTSKRSPDLPDTPTLAENGFPGFDAPAWWAFLAPANTPPDIVKRVNDELNKIMRVPDMAKRLDAQGIDVLGGTPEAARAFIDRQIDVWGKVVRDNNIKAD